MPHAFDDPDQNPAEPPGNTNHHRQRDGEEREYVQIVFQLLPCRRLGVALALSAPVVGKWVQKPGQEAEDFALSHPGRYLIYELFHVKLPRFVAISLINITANPIRLERWFTISGSAQFYSVILRAVSSDSELADMRAKGYLAGRFAYLLTMAHFVFS